MVFKAFTSFLSRRVIKTTILAYQGLVTAFSGQEAFRFELAIFLISIPLAFFVAQTNLQILVASTNQMKNFVQTRKILSHLFTACSSPECCMVDNPKH